MNTKQLDCARVMADTLRAEAQRLCALSWALDSALSLYRKADPATGYRCTEALGDAGTWDAETYAARIRDAFDAGLADYQRAAAAAKGEPCSR